MHAFYCDHFVLPLPEGHRFPMEKYRMLRERIGADPRISLDVPEPATSEALRRVHSPEYLTRVLEGRLHRDQIRKIGFPWSPELVERSRRSVGGTVAAARTALTDGVSVNLAGGTHHAYADRGEGFCVFNDVAVAIRELQSDSGVRRCVVVDLDVHQGNGTAAIFQGDRDVLTISVHGANNYPFAKESSDVDLPLPDGAGDDIFLEAVAKAVDAARGHDPDIVFFVAGADVYADDRLGRLSVTKKGARARDGMVLDAFEDDGVPVAVVMSGGYARDVRDTVDIHATTVTAAAAAVERRRAREGLSQAAS